MQNIVESLSFIERFISYGTSNTHFSPIYIYNPWENIKDFSEYILEYAGSKLFGLLKDMF